MGRILIIGNCMIMWILKQKLASEPIIKTKQLVSGISNT